MSNSQLHVALLQQDLHSQKRKNLSIIQEENLNTQIRTCWCCVREDVSRNHFEMVAWNAIATPLDVELHLGLLDCPNDSQVGKCRVAEELVQRVVGSLMLLCTYISG